MLKTPSDIGEQRNKSLRKELQETCSLYTSESFPIIISIIIIITAVFVTIICIIVCTTATTCLIIMIILLFIVVVKFTILVMLKATTAMMLPDFVEWCEYLHQYSSPHNATKGSKAMVQVIAADSDSYCTAARYRSGEDRPCALLTDSQHRKALADSRFIDLLRLGLWGFRVCSYSYCTRAGSFMSAEHVWGHIQETRSCHTVGYDMMSWKPLELRHQNTYGRSLHGHGVDPINMTLSSTT